MSRAPAESASPGLAEPLRASSLTASGPGLADGASLTIGLIGYGTVGRAVADAVRSSDRPGDPRLRLGAVVRRSSGSFERLLDEADVVVEATSDPRAALQYARASLERGLHFVTAGKQLVAAHGPELEALARRHGVQFRYEGAVAGAVPVVGVIGDAFAGSAISRLVGIVNGSTNYVLSKLDQGAESMQAALAAAHDAGYTEADPGDDLSGRDAAAKMAILARLAFDAEVSTSAIPRIGLHGLTPEDFSWSRRIGHAIKPMAVAELDPDGLRIMVQPTLISRAHPFSSVTGVANAVRIESNEFGAVTLTGPGAGGEATAAAVLGDVLATTRQRARDRASVPLPVVGGPLTPCCLRLSSADRSRRPLERIDRTLGRVETVSRLADDGEVTVLVDRCSSGLRASLAAQLAELESVISVRALAVEDIELSAKALRARGGS